MATEQETNNMWQANVKQMEQAKAAAVAESKKLAPLAGPMSWSGTLQANAMGPGSPEGQITGHGMGTWVNDGLYLLVEGEQTYRVGETTWDWKGHFIAGYDPTVKRFRQIIADNLGVGLKECTLTATTLVVEFPPDVDIEIGGHKIRYRQSYNWNNPKAIKITMERQVDDGAWTVTEESATTNS